MKTLIDGIKKHYPKEAAEAIAHIGDIKLPEGKRVFIGLADNVYLRRDGPFYNVPCYMSEYLLNRERFLINGNILDKARLAECKETEKIIQEMRRLGKNPNAQTELVKNWRKSDGMDL